MEDRSAYLISAKRGHKTVGMKYSSRSHFAKMKLTNKRVIEIVEEVIGEDAIKVVEYLKDRKNISEFKIAEQVKAEIHQIRNILYRLHNEHLVTYTRKKDRQKGWYISYWTFNKKRIKDLIDNMKKQKLETYKERLEKEETNKDFFFMCRNACVRMDFDQAGEFEFKCPECGNLLDQQNNTRTIEFLKEKIKELEAST